MCEAGRQSEKRQPGLGSLSSLAKLKAAQRLQLSASLALFLALALEAAGDGGGWPQPEIRSA